MKKLITISIFFLLAISFTFILDYKRALKDSPPKFAIRINLYKDGGTSVYYGFGYKVIDYNQLGGRKDVVFKSLIISKGTEN